MYGSAERIHCGQQAESDVVGVLRDGVVPGGGFLFDRVGPIPAAKRWADDVEEIESATEPTAQTVVTGVSPEPRADDAAEIEMQGFDDEPETPEPVAGAGEATVDDSESPERQAEIEVDPATVSGVLCPEGHLTNPNAPICHRCGASVGSDAEATTDGAARRPEGTDPE